MPSMSDPKVVESFPMFYGEGGRRVLASDIWSYLSQFNREHVSGPSAQREGEAHIVQAAEFFRGALNPRLASRPLLLYYSYLNLVKFFLLTRGVDLTKPAYHGLAEGETNVKSPNFESDTLDVFPLKGGRHQDVDNVAPYFMKELEMDAVKPSYKITTVFAQIPAVHRVFSIDRVQRHEFCPMDITVSELGGALTAHVTLDTTDSDVTETMGSLVSDPVFKETFPFGPSSSVADTSRKYLSRPIGDASDLPRATRALAAEIRKVGVAYVLTPDRYRPYFQTHERSDRLHQLAASYMGMFYLGSMTRYHPVDYSNLYAKKSWFLGEFLEVDPVQFVYGLSSLIARREVVPPGALRASPV